MTPPSTTSLPPKPATIHYGWFILVSGTLCIFACLGLGRFSLGMLLPSMGKALDLSYGEMGFISTANFVGYLAAVLISSRIMQKIGARLCIASALALVGTSMMLISRVETTAALVPLYVLTGMGSALANVPIMALIAIWFAGNKRGKAAGFVVIGSGFAIIICGQLIPAINTYYPEGWRINWFLLGAIVLCSAVICALVLRNSPQEMGLRPVGVEEMDEQHPSESSSESLPLLSKIVLHCGAIYFLFGFTYVIYVTFVVTSMVEDRGFAENGAGIFWSCIGLLSLISGPVPGALSDRLGRKRVLVAVFSIQALAYLLVALPLSNLFLFLSIVCYGVVAWSVPSIITALVADYAGQRRVAAIFGFVTFLFGIGQISGPYLGGLLAERYGSFSLSFLLASSLAIGAAFLSARLPSKNGHDFKK